MNSSRGQQALVQRQGNASFTPPPSYYPGFQTAVQETTALPPPDTGGPTNNDIAKFMLFEVGPFFVPGGAFVKGAQMGARVLGALSLARNMPQAMATAARIGHAAHHLAHGAHIAHAGHSLAHALSSDSAAPSGQYVSPDEFVWDPGRRRWIHVSGSASKTFTPPPSPNQVPLHFQAAAPAATTAVAPRPQVVQHPIYSLPAFSAAARR